MNRMTPVDVSRYAWSVVIEILLEIVAVGRGLFLAMFLVFFLDAVVARNAAAQTVSGSPDLVISQVYTHGGETGAVFRNDFIELFNRGQSAVDLADYSLVISTIGPGATPDTIISFVSSFGIGVAPGEYLLFQLGSGGNGGGPITFVPRFSDSSIKLGSTSGKIAIVQAKNLAPLGCPIGQDPSLADYVAYGPASCAEGSAPATAPAAANSALVRESAGCTDTDNNAVDFNTAAPSPRNTVSLVNLCTPQSSTNTVQFETSRVNADESQGSVEIFVTRSGNTSTQLLLDF